MKPITEEDVIKLLNEGNFELKSTHDRLSIPIINRLYLKMATGIRFSNIKVADDLIIDGHHRYIASLLANKDLGRDPSICTSAIIVTDWHLIQFVDQDWDTEAKIKMLNEEDAKYNSVRVEEIAELLK